MRWGVVIPQGEWVLRAPFRAHPFAGTSPARSLRIAPPTVNPRVLGCELVAVLAVGFLAVAVSDEAALSHHVPRVVEGSADVEMVRSNTRRIVASMKYVQAGRDRSVSHFIRYAMCCHFAAGLRQSKTPIPPSRAATTPNPTAISLLDERPKAFRDRARDGSVSLRHTRGNIT